MTEVTAWAAGVSQQPKTFPKCQGEEGNIPALMGTGTTPTQPLPCHLQPAQQSQQKYEIGRKWQIWATHLPPNPKHCSGVQQTPCNLTPQGGGGNSSGAQLSLNNCCLDAAVEWQGSGACSLMKGQAGSRNQQDVTLLPLLWASRWFTAPLSFPGPRSTSTISPRDSKWRR